MYERWVEIEESFRSDMRSAREETWAVLAHKLMPEAAGFSSASEVVQHLHAKYGSDEVRDRLLALLVEASKDQNCAGQLAKSMLWLALWPGLTSILRPALERAPWDEDDLAAEAIENLALAISRFDARRATKTAATLLWNTRRLFWAANKRRTDWRPLQSATGGEVGSYSASIVQPHADLVGTVFDLRRLSGPDIDLISACAVEGLSIRELSVRRGLKREVVKKRIQRVFGKIRHGSKRKIVPDRLVDPLIEGEETVSANESCELEVAPVVLAPGAAAGPSERGAR